MNKIKNLIVFGTRPEAIKMAPLVNEFLKNEEFETRVCVTAQHREMLDQVLSFFEITIDYDLNLMKPNQDLYSITANIITDLKPVFEDFDPDYVYVHGDTTTTMASSIAAFYYGAKVCHIEAGLRTFDKRSPFPEEVNRKMTSVIADIHFSPTKIARDNLLKEGVSETDIIVTGNTVIDALLDSVKKVENFENSELINLKSKVKISNKIILVTGHRRENHGKGFINICEALKKIAFQHPDVEIVYPVHLNPNIQKVINENLKEIPNIKLIAPLSYPSFVWLMKNCYLILTDSGGIQEEAPSLSKPVLLMRENTERPEAVEAGTVILVGTDVDKIVANTNKLLLDLDFYNSVSKLHNPYGDGQSCKKIVDYIKDKIK